MNLYKPGDTMTPEYIRSEVHHPYRCACPTVLGDDVEQAIDCAFRQLEHERREQRECPDCTDTRPCERMRTLMRSTARD